MSLSLPNTPAIAIDRGAGHLIADFGHPHFPGWQAMMLLLVLLMAAYSIMSPGDSLIRARASRVPTRISRTVGSRANGRDGKARA
tara:strand:- start:8042 stop:8296 length:255 start_codon:yes stop_codon:yes gene_type:complete